MNLYEKINLVMSEVYSLKKDGKVAFGTTKYNFLSEAKTTETFHDLFVKYKIALLPVEIFEERQGQVTQGKYTYRLINCENPEEFIDLQSGGQGQDSSDKGSGKASSYAYKYLLWRTFAIPSNDDPDQISSAETVAKEKAKVAVKPLEKTKPPIERTKEEILSQKPTDIITEGGADFLLNMCLEVGSKPIDVCKYFGVTDFTKMTVDQFNKAKEIFESKVKK